MYRTVHIHPFELPLLWSIVVAKSSISDPLDFKAGPVQPEVLMRIRIQTEVLILIRIRPEVSLWIRTRLLSTFLHCHSEKVP
jgi:hypothetical protein